MYSSISVLSSLMDINQSLINIIVLSIGTLMLNKNVSFKTNNNLKKMLPNPKDQIKDDCKSGIYGINCNECEKVYIGQTKRKIKQDIKNISLI